MAWEWHSRSWPIYFQRVPIKCISLTTYWNQRRANSHLTVKDRPTKRCKKVYQNTTILHTPSGFNHILVGLYPSSTMCRDIQCPFKWVTLLRVQICIQKYLESGRVLYAILNFLIRKCNHWLPWAMSWAFRSDPMTLSATLLQSLLSNPQYKQIYDNCPALPA